MKKNKKEKVNSKKSGTTEKLSLTSKIKSNFLWLKKYPYLFLSLTLGLLGFLIYSNTLKVPFYFDDYELIIDNPYIKSFSYFSAYNGIADLVHIRYLSNLSFAINYYYSGMEVISYHLVNILIHILNSILVLLLSKQILKSSTFIEKFSDDDKFWITAFAALIFLIHPIQTQAVTYIVQRMTSMATLFYLSSLYFYLLGRNSFYKSNSVKSKLKVIPLFIISGISFLLGLFSKEIVATLPLSIVLIELLFIRNNKMKISWPVVASILLGFFLAGLYVITKIGLPAEAEDFPRHVYLFTQIDVMFTYFRMLVIPISQNIDYDFTLRQSLFEIDLVIKVIILLALFLFALRMSKKYKLISFGILWFFITLSVESSIIPIRDVINEHRLYLPMFGFSILAGVVVLTLSRKISNSNGFKVISIAIVVLFSILSYSRNDLWNDPGKMWSDVISKSPNKDRPYLARGAYFLRNTQYDGAIHDFLTVIKLNKKEFRAYDNLGYAYQSKNQYAEAIQYHEVAIKMNPNSAISYNNRGVCYLYLQQWDNAIKDFEKAVDLFHNYTDAFFNLGYVYYINKEYDKSSKYFIQALDLNPSYQDIYPYLVMNSFKLGNLDQARNYYEKMKQIGMKIPNSIKNIMGN